MKTTPIFVVLSSFVLTPASLFASAASNAPHNPGNPSSYPAIIKNFFESKDPSRETIAPILSALRPGAPETLDAPTLAAIDLQLRKSADELYSAELLSGDFSPALETKLAALHHEAVFPRLEELQREVIGGAYRQSLEHKRDRLLAQIRSVKAQWGQNEPGDETPVRLSPSAQAIRRTIDAFFGNYRFAATDWPRFQAEQGALFDPRMSTFVEEDPIKGPALYGGPAAYFQSIIDWSQSYATDPAPEKGQEFRHEFQEISANRVVVKLRGKILLKGAAQAQHGVSEVLDDQHDWTEVFHLTRDGRILQLEVFMNLFKKR